MLLISRIRSLKSKISKKFSSGGKRLTGAFGLVLVLTGVVSLISYENATQLVESANQIRQNNEVSKTLTDISSTLIEAESGKWSYVLFSDPEYLERYNTAVQSLQPEFARLRQFFASKPRQQQRLDTLESLITNRMDLVKQSIDRYQGTQVEISAQDPLIVQSKQNQDAIRRVIVELQSEEEELLHIQIKQSQSNLQFRILIELLGTFFSFMILFGVYALLYRQMVRRQRAEIVQRALAQQKELSELKLQFFSMVSHEFRTPLSLILGSSQLLGETLKPFIEPAKLKNLYRIQYSAKVMTQLLTDVLTLARADAGKLECHPHRVEMQTFCLNLVEDCQVFSESKCSIKFIQQGHCTHAKVDEKLLYSILSNLLSNAIKYSPPNSSVYFTLICETDAVTFLVKDEGVGISQQDQQLLYEPFSRGKNTSDILGTGLGLAVVKKCLDLHQGEISVESEVGVGTTFTVRIPQKTDCKN